ncbi:Hypp6426 [Branchiostoma lanceolatum]|uniref:Hypp6426 protein n=1 Tax=Branchiostoma lanceolatum TaxID=7740 RepID=A0A8J9YUA1_BRALA|nr:Hypp6426 [Branchiostoma lanceolatum]
MSYLYRLPRAGNDTPKQKLVVMVTEIVLSIDFEFIIAVVLVIHVNIAGDTIVFVYHVFIIGVKLIDIGLSLKKSQ